MVNCQVRGNLSYLNLHNLSLPIKQAAEDMSLSVLQSIDVYKDISMSLSAYRCLSMSLIVYRCLRVSIDVSECLSISLSVYRCFWVFIDVSKCFSMSLTVYRCLLISIDASYIAGYVWGYYIGAHLVQGVWQWGDGVPLNYTNWGTNEPDHPGEQNFGFIFLPGHYIGDYKWGSHKDMQGTSRYICEKDLV